MKSGGCKWFNAEKDVEKQSAIYMMVWLLDYLINWKTEKRFSDNDNYKFSLDAVNKIRSEM